MKFILFFWGSIAFTWYFFKYLFKFEIWLEKKLGIRDPNTGFLLR